MDKAVVLVSGGINSAVAAALVREQYEPALLHVAWGHRTAERELTCFEQLATWLKTDKTMVAELSCVAAFGGNARVSRRLSIEDATTLGSDTPATFVLGLIPAMLSLAATWAAAIDARRIIVGLSENHNVAGPPISMLYPDRRAEFVQTFNLMLEYAKPSGRNLLVEAPLMDLNRAEVVNLGRRVKLPFEKTWSCYRNTDVPCNKCLPCTTRSAGFIRAGVPDPLILEMSSAAAAQ